MAPKIGQVNLMNSGGNTGFNVMYEADGAFGVSVYAGKKLLQGCKSSGSSSYSGSVDGAQGPVQAKSAGGSNDAINMDGVSCPDGKSTWTVCATSSGKIQNAVIVTVEKVGPMIDNQGTGFSTLGITGVNGLLITDVQLHDEKGLFGIQAYN